MHKRPLLVWQDVFIFVFVLFNLEHIITVDYHLTVLIYINDILISVFILSLFVQLFQRPHVSYFCHWCNLL